MHSIDPITGWLVRQESEASRPVSFRPASIIWDRTSSATSAQKSSTIKWSGQGKRDFHECVSEKTSSGGYVKLVFEAKEPDGRYYGNGVATGTLDAPPTFHPYTSTYVYRRYSTAYEVPPDPELDWGAAKDALYTDIDGRMPNDISIPLNVIEFAQLKRLVPQFAKSVKELVNWCRKGPCRKYKIRVHRPRTGSTFYKTYSSNGDRVSLDSLQWGLKDLSSSYLAATFGLKPLADDVSNWITKYWQVKIQSDWYKRVSDGKFHRFTADVAASSDETAYNEGFIEITNGTPNLYMKIPCKFGEFRRAKGRLGAYVRLKPKPELQQLSATLSGILGLNAPLETVWDAIPFSFVADWFLPIGEAIKRVDNRLFGKVSARTASFEIDRMWSEVWTSSTKGLIVEPLTVELPASWNVGDMLDCKATCEGGTEGTTVTRYRRDKGWPVINILPTGNTGWRMARSLISGALVLQRVL